MLIEKKGPAWRAAGRAATLALAATGTGLLALAAAGAGLLAFAAAGTAPAHAQVIQASPEVRHTNAELRQLQRELERRMASGQGAAAIEARATLRTGGELARMARRGPADPVRLLFTGPPGTGKTMAASVLAAELGMDLYRVDLSAVVSKYIGETEKNLARVFDRAKNRNWILFFDEADALFGKRTEVKDAHDKYAGDAEADADADADADYLLRKIREHRGIVILGVRCEACVLEASGRPFPFTREVRFPLEDDGDDQDDQDDQKSEKKERGSE